MRLIPLTLLAMAIAACGTTPPEEPPDLKLRGEASTSCVDNRTWAFAVNRGAVVYEENCDYCHRDDGFGQPGKVPRLAGSESVKGDPERGIGLILVTRKHASPKHGMAVDDLVAIFSDLDTADIADVMTYVRASWGNCAGPVSESDVEAVAAKM